MDLDEFKIMIRENPRKDIVQEPLSRMETFIGKKSRSAVDQIRRNLWIEFLFAVLFIVLILYIVLNSGNMYVNLFGSLMVCYCACFMYYLVRLFKNISYHDATALSIKEYLEQLIHILAAFTRLYFQLTLLMLPVCFFAGLILSYLNRSESVPDSQVPISMREFAIYIIAFIAWSVMMYHFSKLYIRNLYGNHLQKLRDQLRELKNNT